jgi:hypothetical protein
MKLSGKNQVIVATSLMLIALEVVAIWSIIQAGNLSEQQSGGVVSTAEPVYSFSGTVSGVGDNTLVIKSDRDQQDVKVVVTELVRLIKIEFPFDPANPPEEVVFVPKQTPVDFSAFEVGDVVFVKAKDDINGKTELDNLDFIQILP